MPTITYIYVPYIIQKLKTAISTPITENIITAYDNANTVKMALDVYSVENTCILMTITNCYNQHHSTQ